MNLNHFLWGCVSMIYLTFYKGVPLDPTNEDVLFCSVEDRNTFLMNYEINVTPIEKEMFSPIGNDDNCFVDVDLSLEPFEANYLKIEQLNDNESTRVLFYFINSYQMNASNSIRLFLTIDKWNTYFLKQNGTMFELPQLKNAICVQGHNFSNGGEEEEIIEADKTLSYFSYSSIATSFGFRIAYHIVTDNKYLNETTLISSNIYGTFQSALTDLNNLSQFGKGILRYNESNGTTTQEEFTIERIGAYLIPNALISTSIWNLFIQQSATVYFDGESTIFFYPANLNKNKQSMTLKSSVTFQITPKPATITQVGTGKTMIDLPYNNKTYEIRFDSIFSNDIGIQMICNKQRLSITKDYEVNITYSQFSSYVATHEQTEQMKNISYAIGGISSIAGLAGGIISGNPTAIIGGITGGIGTAMSYANNQAKLNDMKSQPLTLSSDTESILTLVLYEGLTKFEWTPANESDIIAYNNYYGYRFNGFYNNLSIARTDETERFRYLKVSELNVIGNFNMNVKNDLYRLFVRGIRIWYDKTHFLDSMTQKIQPQGN